MLCGISGFLYYKGKHAPILPSGVLRNILFMAISFIPFEYDLDQDPDLHYPLVRNELAKAQRSIVPARARAEAAAEAQAKAFPGEI
ncbi:unnamed protein product, partial [Vitis vinifera]|uniref:Uncharacterized protein n=1 Tax=Vitis vinifera TaxID=29760 RepID=D7U283_VITVI